MRRHSVFSFQVSCIWHTSTTTYAFLRLSHVCGYPIHGGGPFMHLLRKKNVWTIKLYDTFEALPSKEYCNRIVSCHPTNKENSNM